MNQNKKSVISLINSEINTQKKNIILTDTTKENFELSKKIMLIFLDYETKIIFYSKEKNNFLYENKFVDNIEELISGASLFFNFIPIKNQVSRDISRKAESLKVNSIQNSLSVRMIFSAKNNIKKTLEKYDFKTPVFEFIGRKTPEESFSNFIQPSRIFSASKNLFSKKLESFDEINDFYNKVGNDISGFFIEEYIYGQNIYSFVFKKDEEILVYSIEKKDNQFIAIETVLSSEVSNYVKNVFNNMGIGKFALINLKKTEKRGIFILNILVDWRILTEEHGKILSMIFKQESVSEKEILFSFLK